MELEQKDKRERGREGTELNLEQCFTSKYNTIHCPAGMGGRPTQFPEAAIFMWPMLPSSNHRSTIY